MKNPIVDRLSDRGAIDRWGFLTFALVGSALILIAKSLGAPPVPVAVGAALSMALYAYVVQSSGTGRLRADQAGDNCYYLGLIYTLCSLAYAIFLFDPANTATTIVQGFGIALATTIMGLVLRVFFNQSRVDLVQTEDTARIELADAAGRLKAELAGALVSMNDFSRQTRQSLEELHEQVTQSMTEVREAASKSIQEAVAAAASSMVNQGAETAARSKRMTTATDRVIDNIERHATAFEALDKSTTGVAASLAALESVAGASHAAVAAVIARSEELSAAQSGIQTTGVDLSQVVANLLESVRALDGSAARFDQFVTARLHEVQAAPEEAVSRAGAGLEDAVGRVRGAMEALVTAQGELAKRAGAAVAAVERHNVALDGELSRSRENVAKVHTALVDMTRELAVQVERQVK